MATRRQSNRMLRSWPTILWLGALTLIGIVALSREAPETAAKPELPVIVVDESLLLHPSAVIATPEEAAAHGLEIVQRWTGAESPRVTKVELIGPTPAWQVSFDGAEFGIRCPPPPPESANYCPPGNRARVTFFASNGIESVIEVGRPGDRWD